MNVMPEQLHNDHRLRVMFVHTSLTIGGEEVLLVEILRRLDRTRFSPHLCCLKDLGLLGRSLVGEVPVFERQLAHKYDIRVLMRLTRLMRDRRIDAVVTVGTGGDKMFWGRLAAWRAGVPVIVSAIHSTGWPIRVEWLNRRLEPLTDAFIAVAENHARHLIEHEGCPDEKVHVIPNGVDVERFRPLPRDLQRRQELNLPAEVPVAGTVAVLRSEKNLPRFLRVAKQVREEQPNAHFLIVGDGPARGPCQQMAAALGLGDAVRFCGRRRDIPHLLAQMDVFLLTSDMEASPVSILEAMACGKPVVSTNVGSIPETVVDGLTGFLASPKDERLLAQRVAQLMGGPALAREMGERGRQRILSRFSVQRMVEGYEDLLESLYAEKQTSGACKEPAAQPVG